MLLDEADVYVHERGNDLQQNAIVGVFLRVLEYQSSVLFLTTNRPDDVDDAIASRCIAKLTYELPTLDEQKRIWQVLTAATGATITEQTIDQIITKNKALSGRDVKNLLKLARVMSDDGEIRADAVEFIKQFKPTRGQEVVVPAGQIRSKDHKCPKARVALPA
jgi:SpoVK/Ycf46/Vps4 family AAA+-type ATPase